MTPMHSKTELYIFGFARLRSIRSIVDSVNNGRN